MKPPRLPRLPRWIPCLAVGLGGAAGVLAAPAEVGSSGLGAGVGDGLSTQTMLWAQRSRYALGLGIEQSAGSPWARDAMALAGPARDTRVLVGLSWATSERTRLVWQAPLGLGGGTPGLRGDGLQARAGQGSQVGLVFRQSDSFAELRRSGLVKWRLSGQTSLALRPRSGRIALTLTSQW